MMTCDTYGTLYGIGVGPGDPDLIPLKAIKALQKVALIFAAASSKNPHSQAVSVARPHLPAAVEVRLLKFPMTKDAAEKNAAWRTHAETILAELAKGRSTAFLTLGDPLTYATYGYVLTQIKALKPEAPVVTIPGITSFQAAAARVNRPLVEGEESLLILSGVEGGQQLRKYGAAVDNVVFLKAYRHLGDIAAALEECDMLPASVAVANCSRENEEVITDVKGLARRDPTYWTLVMAKKTR
ncbi:MAG: precorrin-2 C(20)-methyltransferase [Desulfosarcinaceae bacterium]